MRYRYFKTCPRCGEGQDFSNFYRDARRRDGCRSWCKGCISKDSKSREGRYRETRDKYREESKTALAATKRRYYKENKEKVLNSNRGWRQSPKGRMASYRRAAQSRSIAFDLSEEQFLAFWQQPCYYCGSDISTIGLDRLDSSWGYSLENVVPCCEVCNKMKMALGVVEFIGHISRIYEHLVGGNFYEVC